jgi:hypothetical protein
MGRTGETLRRCQEIVTTGGQVGVPGIAPGSPDGFPADARVASREMVAEVPLTGYPIQWGVSIDRPILRGRVMKRVRLIVTAFTLLFSITAQATPIFLPGAPSVFSGAIAPFGFIPTPPPIIGSPPSGITLTGNFKAPVPGSWTGGTILSWTVVRPIAGDDGIPFTLTATNIGFISDMLGFASYNGGDFLAAEIVRGGAVLHSAVTNDLFLPVATNTFSSSGTSPMISSYTYAAGDFLQLRYEAQIGYSGTGTTFEIDFPASAIVTPVPEPASAVLLAAGLGALGLHRNRRRYRPWRVGVLTHRFSQ